LGEQFGKLICEYFVWKNWLQFDCIYSILLIRLRISGSSQLSTWSQAKQVVFKCAAAMGQQNAAAAAAAANTIAQKNVPRMAVTHCHTLPHIHTLTPIWLHATRLLHFKVNALYMQQQQQSCIALCCVSVWTVRQTNAAVSQVPTCHLPLYPAAAVWPKSLWWNIFALHYATIYDF